MQIGVDIVDIERFSKVIDRWGDRFLRRIFTDREIEEYRDRIESLAVRFAGKEAFFKASNMEILVWKEIEIIGESKPELKLCGKTAENFQGKKFTVSLSHEKKYGIAVVLIY